MNETEHGGALPPATGYATAADFALGFIERESIEGFDILAGLGDKRCIRFVATEDGRQVTVGVRDDLSVCPVIWSSQIARCAPLFVRRVENFIKSHNRCIPSPASDSDGMAMKTDTKDNHPAGGDAR